MVESSMECSEGTKIRIRWLDGVRFVDRRQEWNRLLQDPKLRSHVDVLTNSYITGLIDREAFSEEFDNLCGQLPITFTIPDRQSKVESVNHPKHYNTGKIEVIDFIEDQGLGFNDGNTVKYISRAGKKDPSKHLEDLEKALWYLQREIERVKKNASPE